jgi:3',5'-cyclic AMP phosphodiesterase CpdA
MRSILSLFALLFINPLSVGSAKDQNEEPFFFIQLTDPQLGFFSGNKDLDQEVANLEFAVASVNRLRPAFVIVTGDMINRPGDASQIAEYKRVIAKVDPAIPVYHLAGNHEITNTPTPETIKAYADSFGPDRYTFEYEGLFAIVLNSTIIHTPDMVEKEMDEQTLWLKQQLEIAKEKDSQHIVIFAHHPWFIKSVGEADEYFNIPAESRIQYLKLFKEYGVKYLFCGHYHRNTVGRDQGFESVITGPVGKPFSTDHSGLCIAVVREDVIEHTYHSFGKLPHESPLTDEINQQSEDEIVNAR